MSFSYLHSGLLSGILTSGFPTKILHTFHIISMRATCPSNLIFLDLISLIFGEVYKL